MMPKDRKISEEIQLQLMDLYNSRKHPKFIIVGKEEKEMLITELLAPAMREKFEQQRHMNFNNEKWVTLFGIPFFVIEDDLFAGVFVLSE